MFSFKKILDGTSIIYMIGLVSLLQSCYKENDPTIKRLSGGYVFEEYQAALGDGRGNYPKWIVFPKGGGSASIVIPLDVIWCKSSTNVIYGEKRKYKKVAEWMTNDHDWNFEGFFILDLRKVDRKRMNDSIDDGSVSWYTDRKKFDSSLNKILYENKHDRGTQTK